MRNRWLGIFFCIISVLFFLSWKNAPEKVEISAEDKWVDSVFNSLSLEERIGQLFMVAAYSNKDEKHAVAIETLIKSNGIGGLIFFQGGPGRQANLTNRYQAISKVPLLIAMDAEWGLGMRLSDSTISFPRQMTLGAIQDNTLIYKMGAEIARECRRLGVQVNFAPVVDVNSNPANPVIGIRSFGEDKFNVAQKGLAYMKGMQDYGVIANAKHFPGHGDTETDSHSSMPIIPHSKERLQSVEFYPFNELIANGVKSLMIAHIHLPSYDNSVNVPATISRPIVTDLLRNQMKFEGLIFTDALNMKGVSSLYKPGEVDLLALKAGNDVLLYPENVASAIQNVKKAIKDSLISEAEINNHVKKILRAKYFVGLDKGKYVDTYNLYPDLHTNEAYVLQQQLFDNAVTLVNNKDSLLPLKELDTTNIASVVIGAKENNYFQNVLSSYGGIQNFAIPDKNADDTYFNSIYEKVKNYEVVVVGLHGMNMFNNKTYGISESAKRFINKLNQSTRVVLCVFGNPYSIRFFGHVPYVVCGYEDIRAAHKSVAEMVFGAIEPKGKLPVTVAPDLIAGRGLAYKAPLYRFKYGIPESVGMNSYYLTKIDSIVNTAIADKAMPGCQVLVARNGVVVYNQSFGHLTYDKQQPVTNSTVYDIASITKVAGTLQAVMFLEERGMLDLDKKASYYLPELLNTNKEDIVVRDILTHQAGLIPFIPYWKKTMDTAGFSSYYYSNTKSDAFCNEVIPGVYSIASMEDSLWKWTIESPLLKKNKKTKRFDYQYSDLGFYTMKRITEKLLNQPLDAFLTQNFYKPLGLVNMTFKPLAKIPLDKIAPTEDDKLFRKAQIRGCVHDPGAAMFGGVAGHAGLFSNANDLAILMQMNLQQGYYGGEKFFLSSTVPDFSKQQFDYNRRGLGWDKPDASGNGPTSDYASRRTFGHTGFTGTAVWVDPDQDLVFVFLSNRVYPDAGNTKLIKNNIRTKIHDMIYLSILRYSDR